MGHLGALFLLISPLVWLHSRGHSLPACHKQLEFRCGDGSCILNQSVCDRQKDCKDGSDESHCRDKGCTTAEFSCRNKRCISSHFWCNGVDDCGDGSDEVSCPSCTAGLFPCGPSDACLLRSKVCDGLADCKDGRDELQELCSSAEPPQQASSKCSVSEFQCGDEHCIRQTWRCDHSPDCSDGSDEDNCDQNECQVNNGGCSHICLDQPMGFLCSCPDNMRLVDDTKCEEVDTCLETDVCDQLCVHLNGHNCDCHEGYYMNSTTGECKAKGDEAQLVFTASKGIRWKNLAASHLRELAPHLPGTGPVAAMASSRTVYWAPVGQGLIYRGEESWSSRATVTQGFSVSSHQLMPINGSLCSFLQSLIRTQVCLSRETMKTCRTVALEDQGSLPMLYRTSLDGKAQKAALVLRTEASVSGLALDWVNRLLYWTGPELGCVNVALLDGSAQRVLVSELDQPSAVAVNPLRQLLFWTVCGNSPKIERAGLDGRGRIALVESSLHEPVALSLDMPRQLLYWFDQKTRSISRVDLEGRHRKTMIESNGYLDKLFGLAVFEGFVYWSDEVTHSICRADKHNGRNLTVQQSRITSPGGVAIVHPVLQPNGSPICKCPGTVCQKELVIDLQSENSHFTCISPRKGQNESQEVPTISRTVSGSALSDPTMAGILSLIVFLSVLLAGLTVWWCRDEFRPPRSLTTLRLSLKESRDPLIAQGPHVGPNTSLTKETLLKPDLDGEWRSNTEDHMTGFHLSVSQSSQ